MNCLRHLSICLRHFQSFNFTRFSPAVGRHPPTGLLTMLLLQDFFRHVLLTNQPNEFHFFPAYQDPEIVFSNLYLTFFPSADLRTLNPMPGYENVDIQDLGPLTVLLLSPSTYLMRRTCCCVLFDACLYVREFHVFAIPKGFRQRCYSSKLGKQ